MAVWTERSNTDKASLTKMKMTLSCGRSDEYDMFLHLRGGDRDNCWMEAPNKDFTRTSGFIHETEQKMLIK